MYICMYLYVNMRQQAEKAEFEIEDFIKQKEGTEIRAYALVDLDNEIAYGFKVRSEDKISTSLIVPYITFTFHFYRW